MSWTLFWDMHSGGSSKEKQCHIYIEAPEDEAKVIFYNRFGHSPDRISCTCCGGDYSIYSGKSFEQVAGYHMGWQCKGNTYVNKPSPYVVQDQYMTVSQYKRSKNVLVIPASKIKKSERTGEVPEQGYVWR